MFANGWIIVIIGYLGKFGFDTAESEPEYGYGISLIFVSLIFGPGRRC